MKQFNALLEALENDETIKTFKQLEHAVRDNETYLKAYENITRLQKRMVQANHYKSKEYAEHKKRYEEAVLALEGMPIVHQYLEYQEHINSDIQLLFTIIEQEINAPFEEKH